MSEPVLSYEEFQRSAGSGPTCNRLLDRLFWRLNGPIEDSIFVLEDVSNPEGRREAYCTSDGTGYHPISQEPLTEPPISSVSTAAYPMDRWAADWEFFHGQHSDPDDPDCVWEGEVMVRCCEEDKPVDLLPLIVQASAKPYVTIHDFVTAVHPWLLDHHQDVLACLRMEYDSSPSEELKLAINCTSVKVIMIETEDDWIGNRRSRVGTQPQEVSTTEKDELLQLKRAMGIQ